MPGGRARGMLPAMASLGAYLGSYLGGAGVSAQSAAQSSLNSVDVVFGSEPPHLDPDAIGDGLRLANYTLAAVTPGAFVPLPQVAAFVAPTTIRVFYDAPLADDAEYQITVANVASAVLPFSTVSAGRVLPQTQIGENRTDIRNRAIDGSPGYDSTGDLANHAGAEYRRKRLIRRITTAVGSIFHLPGYGLGLRPKQLLRSSVLRDIASRARAQILREPDIRAAQVDVQRSGTSRIVIRVRPTDVNDVLLPEIRIPIDTSDL